MTSDRPLAVGLAGAGPWAQLLHAPLLAAGPETHLAGVWARRPEAATELAGRHGTVAFDRFDALLDACEAVAFAVPPGVQAELAVRAARAGKALLLEKPVALDVAAAERIVDAVGEAGVASVVVLSYRFTAGVRAFLERAATFGAIGGRACFISGAFLGGPFAASPWRLEHGALLDVGPHVLDLVDAALGTITGLRAHGDRRGWVGILCEHESGARSEVSLCCTAAIEPSRTDVQLYGPNGALDLDARAQTGPDAFATLRRELADAARAGGGHPLDARRGLHLQRLIAAAVGQL